MTGVDYSIVLLEYKSAYLSLEAPLAFALCYAPLAAI